MMVLWWRCPCARAVLMRRRQGVLLSHPSCARPWPSNLFPPRADRCFATCRRSTPSWANFPSRTATPTTAAAAAAAAAATAGVAPRLRRLRSTSPLDTRKPCAGSWPSRRRRPRCCSPATPGSNGWMHGDHDCEPPRAQPDNQGSDHEDQVRNHDHDHDHDHGHHDDAADGAAADNSDNPPPTTMTTTKQATNHADHQRRARTRARACICR